jgi:plastocyanin
MNKSVVIFTVAVLLVLVCGCTQPAHEQTAITPATIPATTHAPTTLLATVVATPHAILTTGSVSPTIQNSVSANTIRINRKGFDPARISVPVGSTVRWVNEDSTVDPQLYNPTHRIALVDLENSPLLSSGQGWSRIFTEKGSYDYNDMIHTTLTGTVIVV